MSKQSNKKGSDNKTIYTLNNDFIQKYASIQKENWPKYRYYTEAREFLPCFGNFPFDDKEKEDYTSHEVFDPYMLAMRELWLSYWNGTLDSFDARKHIENKADDLNKVRDALIEHQKVLDKWENMLPLYFEIDSWEQFIGLHAVCIYQHNNNLYQSFQNTVTRDNISKDPQSENIDGYVHQEGPKKNIENVQKLIHDVDLGMALGAWLSPQNIQSATRHLNNQMRIILSSADIQVMSLNTIAQELDGSLNHIIHKLSEGLIQEGKTSNQTPLTAKDIDEFKTQIEEYKKMHDILRNHNIKNKISLTEDALSLYQSIVFEKHDVSLSNILGEILVHFGPKHATQLVHNVRYMEIPNDQSDLAKQARRKINQRVLNKMQNMILDQLSNLCRDSAILQDQSHQIIWMQNSLRLVLKISNIDEKYIGSNFYLDLLKDPIHSIRHSFHRDLYHKDIIQALDLMTPDNKIPLAVPNKKEAQVVVKKKELRKIDMTRGIEALRYANELEAEALFDAKQYAIYPSTLNYLENLQNALLKFRINLNKVDHPIKAQQISNKISRLMSHSKPDIAKIMIWANKDLVKYQSFYYPTSEQMKAADRLEKLLDNTDKILTGRDRPKKRAFIEDESQQYDQEINKLSRGIFHGSYKSPVGEELCSETQRNAALEKRAADSINYWKTLGMKSPEQEESKSTSPQLLNSIYGTIKNIFNDIYYLLNKAGKKIGDGASAILERIQYMADKVKYYAMSDQMSLWGEDWQSLMDELQEFCSWLKEKIIPGKDIVIDEGLAQKLVGYIYTIQDLSSEATKGIKKVIEEKLVTTNQLSDKLKQEIKKAIGDILDTNSVNKEQSYKINHEVDNILNKHVGTPNSKGGYIGK